jgi:hypothetical protein
VNLVKVLDKNTRRLRTYMYYAKHFFANAFRKEKPVHIIICGTSLSGATILYKMIRSSVEKTAWCPSQDISALSTLSVFARTLITKSLLDVLRASEIQAKLGRIRQIRFIIMIRDPRALVSSKHKSVPNQYFQGFDYQFYVDSKNGVKSYTNPGVSEIFRAIENLASLPNTEHLIVKYEDLVQNPVCELQKISLYCGVQFSDSLHNCPVNSFSLLSWLEAGSLSRVKKQLRFHPDLERIAQEYGYQPISRFGEDANDSKPAKENKGCIIGFHTPDAVYSAEAKRLRKSIEMLSLPHEISEVPACGSWVENCSMKPTWILEKRVQLRGQLLYLDVDAVLHSDPWPYLEMYDGDIAVFISKVGKLLSGTIWINDTPGAHDLLTRWKRACDISRNVHDQRILQEIIEGDEASDSPYYKVQRLPVNLTYIFDKPYEYVFGSPIVEHLQASRIGRSMGQLTLSLQQRNERVKQLSEQFLD